MASDRQIAANRRNARLSSGPRTLAGKARSRANALRHGLATSLSQDPDTVQKIECLAKELVGHSNDFERNELAYVAAECHFELQRIREVRTNFMRKLAEMSKAAGYDHATTADLIAKINRYERRIQSKQRKARKKLNSYVANV